MSPQLLQHSKQQSLFDTPKEVKTPYLLSLLLVSITALLALVMYSTFPPVVPLFYSLSEHSQQLAAKEWLLFIPGFGFGIFILNAILSRYLKGLEMMYIKILAWVTTVMLGMLLFALIRLVIIL